jgi:hypothetical protein
MRSLTHREDMYKGTDSSWVSIRFRSQVFTFYSIDGNSRIYYMSSHTGPDGHCLGFFVLTIFFSQQKRNLHILFSITLHWCSFTWFCWIGL